MLINKLIEKWLLILFVLSPTNIMGNDNGIQIYNQTEIDSENLIYTDTMRKKINSNPESLDIEWFEKNSEEYPSDEYSDYIYDQRNDSLYTHINGNRIDGYVSIEQTRDEYFAVFKNYYSNGSVKEKGLRFHSSGFFKKGVWYEFDVAGNLVKTTDYDQFYKFTFEDVLRYCNENNILVEKAILESSSGFHTSINRVLDESNKYIWVISWLKTPETLQHLILDANTGKVIRTEESEYINN